MSRLLVEGKHRISGTASVHGAKNSVLPILAATLLCDKVTLHNCPQLSDVTAAAQILAHLGCDVTQDGDVITVSTKNAQYRDPPDELMSEMRSSILFLGAIISRFKRAKITFPGGCELGARPIDLHIMGLRKLGITINEFYGYLDCVCDETAVGSVITLPFPSVGATENILLAAAISEGTTIIHNAAREPEIVDLAHFLNKCGANITICQDSISIEGVDHLPGCTHSVIPDRIQAATLLCAAAVTAGEITLTNCCPAHMTAMFPVFEEMGCQLDIGETTIHLIAPERLQAVRSIKTMPYPGFPTDIQAPIMATLCTAVGSSLFVETIFESRFKHVPQLQKLGASIVTEGRIAVVTGVTTLHGASVECTDLRGGAAMVVAALAAEGVTTITDLKHIDRGYSDFEKTLLSLGAQVKRI